MVNDEMRRTWTTGADGWVANEALMDALFVPVTDAIVSAAGFASGQSVLDVGCGTGTLLAAGASAGAVATGIDISPVMVEGASRRVPEAHVVVEDAQTADLGALPGAPFSRVVSRFGVMFFDDPVVAFANIRSATAPGGRMTFACWRSRAENPMFTLGTSVLVAQMPPPPVPPVTGASGPMAFEDPNRVTELLVGGGWSDVSITPLDFTCDYGADGVEARLTVILGTTTGIAARAELEPRLGTAGWEALLDDVRADIRRWQGAAATLTHPAACWLVTATA